MLHAACCRTQHPKRAAICMEIAAVLMRSLSNVAHFTLYCFVLSHGSGSTLNFIIARKPSDFVPSQEKPGNYFKRKSSKTKNKKLKRTNRTFKFPKEQGTQKWESRKQAKIEHWKRKSMVSHLTLCKQIQRNTYRSTLSKEVTLFYNSTSRVLPCYVGWRECKDPKFHNSPTPMRIFTHVVHTTACLVMLSDENASTFFPNSSTVMRILTNAAHPKSHRLWSVTISYRCSTS